MSEFPEIVTPRVRLRALRREDAAEYAELRSDPTTYPFLDGRPLDVDHARAAIDRYGAEFEAGRAIYWAATSAQDGRFLGYVALHDPSGREPAVSFAIRRPDRRRGLARESVQAVVEHAFRSLRCACVTAATHLDNSASAELMRGLSFADLGATDTPLGRRLRFRRTPT